jgi:hypothetical protein
MIVASDKPPGFSGVSTTEFLKPRRKMCPYHNYCNQCYVKFRTWGEGATQGFGVLKITVILPEIQALTL